MYGSSRLLLAKKIIKLEEKTMKALIVKWQDTNKYVLQVKSNNDLLLERKKQEHDHLHPKIVSWDEWELIQACQ